MVQRQTHSATSSDDATEIDQLRAQLEALHERYERLWEQELRRRRNLNLGMQPREFVNKNYPGESPGSGVGYGPAAMIFFAQLTGQDPWTADSPTETWKVLAPMVDLTSRQARTSAAHASYPGPMASDDIEAIRITARVSKKKDGRSPTADQCLDTLLKLRNKVLRDVASQVCTLFGMPTGRKKTMTPAGDAWIAMVKLPTLATLTARPPSARRPARPPVAAAAPESKRVLDNYARNNRGC